MSETLAAKNQLLKLQEQLHDVLLEQKAKAEELEEEKKKKQKHRIEAVTGKILDTVISPLVLLQVAAATDKCSIEIPYAQIGQAITDIDGWDSLISINSVINCLYETSAETKFQDLEFEFGYRQEFGEEKVVQFLTVSWRLFDEDERDYDYG